MFVGGNSLQPFNRINALTIQNHVLRRRVEDRATTDRFAERFAEVTQTGVADLDCRFGDIKPTAA